MHIRFSSNCFIFYPNTRYFITARTSLIPFVKLAGNTGRIYSREQLLDSIWGVDFVGDPRTVDSHVARLRTKLGVWGEAHLRTVYGVGYKIEV